MRQSVAFNFIVGLIGFFGSAVFLAENSIAEVARDVLPVEDASASTEKEMKPYVELIEHTEAKFELVPIPGGRFTMGSPESEADRRDDEGPQHEVEVSPFWMSQCEITWNVYDVWAADLDLFIREQNQLKPNKRDELADVFQISQPTKPYMDMSFGMGSRGYPAICMTQHAARTFCKWLTAKTGRYYRLPTEAEWEYACRAGSTTAYSFGDDPGELDEYAWYIENTQEKYAKVGLKKPNAFGLHDMHGNAAEWVLDQYAPDGYPESQGKTVKDPLAIPKTLYPRVVRGGGWNQDAELLRSAAREGSTEDWIEQDPQIPVSIWYLTDALHVGIRIVRPLSEPSEEEKLNKWEASLPVMKEREVPLER
ncbi:MAG: SUMF1/EgtB/PvdO family nonheme iron enzyme [Pirellulaceae bacterium]|nr:SUMF1/EgtB/PvdO family nonheme iron enzyme [Pirellulaceae bacterium]